jgi:hypothetical protein
VTHAEIDMARLQNRLRKSGVFIDTDRVAQAG